MATVSVDTKSVATEIRENVKTVASLRIRLAMILNRNLWSQRTFFLANLKISKFIKQSSLFATSNFGQHGIKVKVEKLVSVQTKVSLSISKYENEGGGVL